MKYFGQCLFFQVKDMNSSKEFQTSFEQFLLEDPNVHLGMKLKVKVLTPDCWPYKRPVDHLRLPEEMVILYIIC